MFSSDLNQLFYKQLFSVFPILPINADRYEQTQKILINR